MSSAEVKRLWEEPTECTGPKFGSVGILAASGGEDVKNRNKGRRRDYETDDQRFSGTGACCDTPRRTTIWTALLLDAIVADEKLRIDIL